MTTAHPKRPRDPNQLAKLIVDIATGEADDTPPPPKSPAQVKGGKAGGRARAQSLSASERSEIARKAAKARWG